MRQFSRLKAKQRVAIFAVAVLLASCRPKAEYSGDGQVSNTTTWEEFARIPERTIFLGEFPLSSNLDRDYHIGPIAFFNTNVVSLMVRFIDTHTWWRFSEFHPGSDSASSAPDAGPRNIEDVSSRLSYDLHATNGATFAKSAKLLKDYTWGQARSDNGRMRIDIYEPADQAVGVPRDFPLILKFSYTGDPNLTNYAQLVLVCHRR